MKTILKGILDDSKPWATITLIGLTVIYAVVGGVVVVTGAISFESYGTRLLGFAGALGLLGIGRGIAATKTPPRDSA
jgi:hypothetical protein